MRKTFAVGRKEFHQIVRDRRSLGILLLFPAFVLLLFGYALNWDVRHIALAVDDRDRSPESRALISAFVNSGYFDLAAIVDSDAELTRLMDRNDARAVLVIPPGFEEELERQTPVSVQLLLNGDNANTATTVMGYALTIVQSEAARRRSRTGSGGPRVVVEPRIWYNPQLRSTLFLVPGLIAYISMLSAVVSTALSIVREKERGTIEQVRMAPLGPFAFVLGKTIPYFVLALVSALGVVFVAMVLFGLPMRGSWLLLLAAVSLFLVGALGPRPADLERRRHAAGRVSARPAGVVPADADAVRVHLPDCEHAAVASGDHPHRAGALFPDRAARNPAEGGRRGGRLAAIWWRSLCSAGVVLTLASVRLRRQWS